MTDVRKFLDVEYESLEQEEDYLKEILRDIREVEAELRAEEREVLFLESIIKRLKGRIAHFHQHIFPQLAIFIAKLHGAGEKQYSPRLNEWILAFAEIEFDFNIVDQVVSRINDYFRNQARKQLEENKFYDHLLREHNANKQIVTQTRELLFGDHSTGHIYNYIVQKHA